MSEFSKSCGIVERTLGERMEEREDRKEGESAQRSDAHGNLMSKARQGAYVHSTSEAIEPQKGCLV